MAEHLEIAKGTKEDKYKALLPQVKGLLEGETDYIANMANLSAVLKSTFNFFWVGFYVVREGELVLGPFQGPLACTRIRKGKGVCGTSWQDKLTVLVDDVDAFPGHIACSSLSKSEIVVPLIHEQEVWAVLDVDSDTVSSFDEIDKKYLEEMVTFLKKN